MKKFIFMVLLFVCTKVVTAQMFEKATTIATSTSATNNPYIYSSQTDAKGNLYICGAYNKTITLGNITLKDDYNYNPSFLAKFDSSNHVVWARGFSVYGFDPKKIAVDSNGNLYLAASLLKGSALTIDNDSVAYMREYGEIVLIKFDSNGLCKWINVLGSDKMSFNPNVRVNDLITDSENNVIITGYGSNWFHFDKNTVMDVNKDFTAKYSSSGALLWGKKYNPTSNSNDWDVVGYSNTGIIKSGSGFILAGIDNDEQKLFVRKIDKNGISKIVKFGTTKSVSNSVKISSAGNSFVLHGYNTSTFQYGGVTVSSVGAFLIYCDTATLEPKWVKSIQGMYYNTTNIEGDKSGNIYFYGLLPTSWSLIFDTNFTINSTLYFNTNFIAKYSPQGSISWLKLNKNSPTPTYSFISTLNTDKTGKLSVIGSCEFGTSFDNITLDKTGLFCAQLNNKPDKPWAITGNTKVCTGESSYSTLNSTDFTYDWKVTGGASITPNGNSTKINFKKLGSYTISVTASNKYGISIPETLQVQVDTMPKTPQINGDTSTCLGNSGYLTPVIAGNTCTWKVSDGGDIYPTDNATIIVDWKKTGNQYVQLYATNWCGNSSTTTLPVLVQQIPDQPSVITGNIDVGVGTQGYSITQVEGMEYEWTVSGGGKVTPAGNKVSIQWTSAGTHTISVTPVNKCGVGPARILTVEVHDIPSQPSVIIGDKIACVGTYYYSVMDQPGVSYMWALSGGGALSASGNTAEIFWSEAGTYTLTVTPYNKYGTGTPRSANITVKDIPQAPSQIIGLAEVCKGIQSYLVTREEGVNYRWALSGGGIISTKDNIAEVNWNTAGTHTLSVAPYNLCGTGSTASMSVVVNNTQSQAGDIVGETAPCLTTQSYSVKDIGGYTYNWNLSGGGTITPNKSAANIQWKTAGTYQLTVTMSDACTSSKIISVGDIPKKPAYITGSTTVCAGTASYYIPKITGETYSWKISGGGTLTSSANTATVNWTTPGNYTLTVTPSNYCGEGTALVSNITVLGIPAIPNEISGESLTCEANKLYQITDNSGGTSTYNWTLESTGATLIPNGIKCNVVWQQAQHNILYVKASNQCGTSGVRSLAIDVADIPQVSEIVGDETVCLVSEKYSIKKENFATYTWNLSGGGTMTAQTDTATILWKTPGVYILSVTPKNHCGTGAVFNKNITVQTVPEKVAAIAGNISVCQTLEIYSATSKDASAYNWQLSGGGAITSFYNTSNINWTTAGKYTLTVTPQNQCGAGLPQNLEITVNTPPSQVDKISGDSTSCLLTKNYSVIQATDVSSYQWILNGGGTLTSAGNKATIVWKSAGVHTITIIPQNKCGLGQSQTKNVVVSTIPNSPTFSEAPASVCLGGSMYSVNKEAETNYTWKVSEGGTITAENYYATVNWNASGIHTLSVTPANQCGNGTPATLNVNVKTVPQKLQAINGNASVCLGNQNYSTNLLANTEYLWTVSGGGSLSQNQNNASLNWTNAGNFTLNVTPKNECGLGEISTLKIEVKDIPSQTSEIIGNESACNNTSNELSVTAVSGVSYLWELSEGGNLTQNSNKATIQWTTAGNHTIKVSPQNVCGTGTSRSKVIAVNDVPQQVSYISGDEDICLGTKSYNVPLIDNTGYVWTLASGGTLTQDANFASVNFTQTGTHILNVTPQNQCGNGLSKSLQIKVSTIPSQPEAISGKTSVCTGTELYGINQQDGTTYLWAVNGGGNLSPVNNSTYINWLSGGSYTISVSPQNKCGKGESRSLAVIVNTVPNQPSEIDGEESVCKNSTNIYKVTEQNGVTYLWQNTGGTINSENSSKTETLWNLTGSHIITVTPQNQCGTGISRSKVVTVSDVPLLPSVIDGETEGCINTTTNYSIVPQNFTNYTWVLTSGGTILSDKNPTTVSWTEVGNHTITVTPKNYCGEGLSRNLSVTIREIPRLTEYITMEPEPVCTGTKAYQVEILPNTTYNWQLDGGGTLTAGNSNSAVVDWFVTGTHYVKVTPQNFCGNGNTVSFGANVITTPSPITRIDGETSVCENQSITYSIKNPEIVSYNWLLSGGGNLNANNSNATVTWNQSGLYELQVTPLNTCGYGKTANVLVRVTTGAPHFENGISGKEQLCVNESQLYVTPFFSETKYDWENDGGTLKLNHNIVEASWETTGDYLLKVFAENACGSANTELAVKVDGFPQIPEIIFSNDTLYSSVKNDNIWYLNGEKITGANSSYFVPQERGSYSVKVKNTCGESELSSAEVYTDKKYKTYGIVLSPNPASDYVNVYIPINLKWSKMEISNAEGLNTKTDNSSETENRIQLPLTGFAPGIYFITIYTEKGKVNRKLVICN